MKRNVSVLLVSLGFALALGTSASAQRTYNFQVSNLTLSNGDPTYSISDDVTFKNLSLNATYADNTTATFSLFDSSNGAQTSLDTTTITLSSANVPVTSAHGAITTATLTGQFSLTSVNIVTTLFGASTPATINQNFTATLTGNPIYGLFTNINAVSSTGAFYAAGTFGTTSLAGVDPLPTPEPALPVMAAATLAIIGGLIVRRRSIKM